MELEQLEMKHWKDQGKKITIHPERTPMKVITVHFTLFQLEGLEKLVNDGWYPSRSECIRAAVSDLLASYIHQT